VVLGKSQHGVFVFEESFQQVSPFGLFRSGFRSRPRQGFFPQTLLAKLLIEILPLGKVAHFASALVGVLIQTQQQFFHGSSPRGT
jgi:hypothetical protein